MGNSATITVTVTKPTPETIVTSAPVNTPDIAELRLQSFLQQQSCIQDFFDLYQSLSSTAHLTNSLTPSQSTSNLFYIAQKKSTFVETAKFAIAQNLDVRDVASLDLIQPLFDNLYVVDDLVMAIVATMSPQPPIGWQVASQGLNLLNLPTLGPLPVPNEPRPHEASVAATVLQFFGVASYTQDRGYFIGHVLGYLFCCYYFAQLGIGYGVTPLSEKIAGSYPYQAVTVPELVRLLQAVDETLKSQVYQLAVYTAQMSEYTLDKRIERMLITEVNSFDKQALRDELSQNLTYGGMASAPLFQALKPIR